MEQLNVWSQSVDWVSILYNIALWIIPLLFLVAGSVSGGALAVKAVRWLAHELRPHLDEPQEQEAIAAVLNVPVDFVEKIERLLAAIESIPQEAIPAPEPETATGPQEAVR